MLSLKSIKHFLYYVLYSILFSTVLTGNKCVNASKKNPYIRLMCRDSNLEFLVDYLTVSVNPFPLWAIGTLQWASLSSEASYYYGTVMILAIWCLYYNNACPALMANKTTPIPVVIRELYSLQFPNILY